MSYFISAREPINGAVRAFCTARGAQRISGCFNACRRRPGFPEVSLVSRAVLMLLRNS